MKPANTTTDFAEWKSDLARNVLDVDSDYDSEDEPDYDADPDFEVLYEEYMMPAVSAGQIDRIDYILTSFDIDETMLNEIYGGSTLMCLAGTVAGPISSTHAPRAESLLSALASPSHRARRHVQGFSGTTTIVAAWRGSRDERIARQRTLRRSRRPPRAAHTEPSVGIEADHEALEGVSALIVRQRGDEARVCAL